MIQIEKELAAMDRSEAKVLQQLILRSEELVSWVSARVPFVVASEIFDLVSFYQDLARKLTSIDFEKYGNPLFLEMINVADVYMNDNLDNPSTCLLYTSPSPRDS